MLVIAPYPATLRRGGRSRKRKEKQRRTVQNCLCHYFAEKRQPNSFV